MLFHLRKVLADGHGGAIYICTYIESAILRYSRIGSFKIQLDLAVGLNLPGEQ